LLSRPGWDVAGMWLSPALLAAAAAVWFYLRLDLRFGLVLGLLLGLCPELKRAVEANAGPVALRQKKAAI